MSSESVSIAADKSEPEQLTADWAGLVVCGLVTAVIWFFAIQSVMTNGEFEASSLECNASYGISQDLPCATP